MTFIIGCSQRKSPESGAAVDVYRGSIWQTWKKHNTGHKCLALSALHGLIPSETQIDPYDCLLGRDVSMQTMTEQVQRQLSNLDLDMDDIYVLTSKKYAEVLTDAGLDFTFVSGGIGIKRQKLAQLCRGVQ